jgi:dTDP-4-dehydrorhamnose reductase
MDIYFAPLLVNDLAQLLKQSIELKLQGLYHLASRDTCSKFEFAKMIAQILNKDVSLVQESNSDSVAFKAKRPKNTSLSAYKMTSKLGTPLPSIEEGLQNFKALLENGYVERLGSGFVQKGV